MSVKPATWSLTTFELEQSLPADADAKLLVILIYQQSRREEMARRFYHLVSWEAIEASYRKRSQAASAEQIALLQKERDQARASADKMAEPLALAKPGQMSEICNQALRLFVDGRTEEALKVSGRGGAADKIWWPQGGRKEEAEKAIEQAAAVVGSEGPALIFCNSNLRKPTKRTRRRVQAAPESFEVNFAYAHFNQDLNRYTDGEEGLRGVVWQWHDSAVMTPTLQIR